MGKLRRLVTPVMTPGAGPARYWRCWCARQADFQTILLRLLSSMVHEGEADLAAEPRAWRDIVANELDSAFWALHCRRLGMARMAWHRPLPTGSAVPNPGDGFLPLALWRGAGVATAFCVAGSHAGGQRVGVCSAVAD